MSATPPRRSAPSKRAPLAALPERHARGRVAEEAARVAVIEDGFIVLWQNLRIGALEIDLVARKHDLVAIIEVRARGAGSFEKPLASVSLTKRRTLLRAARALYRGRLAKMTGIARVRIDVVAVTFAADGDAEVEWIRGAVTEDDVRR